MLRAMALDSTVQQPEKAERLEFQFKKPLIVGEIMALFRGMQERGVTVWYGFDANVSGSTKLVQGKGISENKLDMQRIGGSVHVNSETDSYGWATYHISLEKRKDERFYGSSMDFGGIQNVDCMGIRDFKARAINAAGRAIDDYFLKEQLP